MADVTAWCLLALVLAIGRGSGIAAPLVAAGIAAVLAVVVLKVVRPRSVAIFGSTHAAGRAACAAFAVVLVFMFVAALVTESIGIHAIFGAFLAGMAVGGAAELRDPLRRAIEPLAGSVLVPVFFAYSGPANGDWARSGGDWIVCGAIIATAVIGKLGGTALAARWTGMPWRDSLALGALMNTRGLMELIVLNVGYDLASYRQRSTR